MSFRSSQQAQSGKTLAASVEKITALMKKILFCSLILLASCKYKHFQFDDVDHYRSTITDDKFSSLIRKENKSEHERKFESLLTGNYLDDTDEMFVANLNKFYTRTSKINDDEISAIEEIYYDGFNFMKSKCIPIYRDILIFKQNDTIVGISKICFDCDMNYTVDKNGIKKEFDNADYKSLSDILK
jgi:hypothetical protein